MMEQVVLNLAINARDAMPGGGKLTVRTAMTEIAPDQTGRHADAYAGKFVCLTVIDSGSGMSAEVLTRIFEPFFTTKDVGRGTGLGLATVFAIVQQHRGWIEVQSRVGTGTTFEIFLPASSQQRVGAAVAAPSSTRGGSETILLVEDEEAVRALGKLILEMSGYRVVEARSGVEALAKWADHSDDIDLLLTDMIMPEGMTGRQLALELSASKPSLKVIFTSGYSSDFSDIDISLVEGVNFLQKPYEIESLLRTIRKQFDGA